MACNPSSGHLASCSPLPEVCDWLGMCTQEQAAGRVLVQHTDVALLQCIADKGSTAANLALQLEDILCQHARDWLGLPGTPHCACEHLGM